MLCVCDTEAVPTEKCLSDASVIENTEVTVKEVYHTKSSKVYCHFSLFVWEKDAKALQRDNPSASLDRKDVGLSASIMCLFSIHGHY